ncbi:MAG: family 1 glycosylhydrolase [Actinomycetota bacterium]|nr:family 1 glycosylhydrolase [Actinomycetota bacterium]
MSALSFPPGFLWGTATSAYQVEGGNHASDWWLWERKAGSGCAERSGDACDHYHRYPGDIEMIADLGFNTYRFSLEWSRIEPEQGEYSRAQLDHYRRMLESCHEHGVEPMVTFHHFTSPRWVAAQGGWERPDTAEDFARYCQVAAEHLGDLFEWAIPINEPNMPPLLGYQDGIFPPGRRDPATRERVNETFIRAHRLGVEAIRSGTRARVGMALAMVEMHPVDGGQVELDRIRDVREDVFLAATQDDDFMGVNAYTRHEVGPEGIRPPRAGAELTGLGWEYRPEALEACVRRAAGVTGKPVVVTENGIATDHDPQRIAYITEALRGIHRCLLDGLEVLGYLYWSALDNFEWNHGYGPKFGLIAVDRATQERTPRPSAQWLGNIARTGAL